MKKPIILVPTDFTPLGDSAVACEIVGLDKKEYAKDFIEYATRLDTDLLTIINNHEKIFTYFGGSFEQSIFGNKSEIPALVINQVASKSAYSFSIYFG
jgi:hypothetical protein